MFLHHLASIFLLSFSYVNNMARVGTLVLCLHDSADALLEVKIFLSSWRRQNPEVTRSPDQQSYNVMDDTLKLLAVLSGLQWHENVCAE